MSEINENALEKFQNQADELTNNIDYITKQIVLNQYKESNTVDYFNCLEERKELGIKEDEDKLRSYLLGMKYMMLTIENNLNDKYKKRNQRINNLKEIHLLKEYVTFLRENQATEESELCKALNVTNKEFDEFIFKIEPLHCVYTQRFKPNGKWKTYHFCNAELIDYWQLIKFNIQ